MEKGEEQIEEGIQEHFKQLTNLDDKVLNNKIELDNKLRGLSDIFRALADEDRYDVKKEILIQELVNTGKTGYKKIAQFICQVLEYDHLAKIK